MNLYKIKFLHASQKDTKEGIITYALADSDELLYEYIDSTYNYDCWEGENLNNKLLDIYDDNYNIIGTESFREKIIRIKGEMNDEDADFSDAYYGITLYGWELVEENTNELHYSHLIELGVIIKINNIYENSN